MALFSFVQAEFPWALGPDDGRYLLRDAGGAPAHVVVLLTLGARRRHRLAARRRTRPTTSEPAPVATCRATVIASRPLADEAAAREWLHRADEDSVAEGLAIVNRVLFAHRLAAADPGVHEVSAAQALVLRAGYGDGEAVSEGRWRAAREVLVSRGRGRRNAALRPQERLALLLGGRAGALVVEELALRARADLDGGRPRHAALELRSAYDVGLAELEREGDPALAERLAELRALQGGVEAAARDADPAAHTQGLEHALARLQAALRARAAARPDIRSGHGRLVGDNPRPPADGGA